MIAARPRRARAALSWEETHDVQFVRAVYSKDVQPGIQDDFSVRDDAAGSLMYCAVVWCQRVLSCGRRNCSMYGYTEVSSYIHFINSDSASFSCSCQFCVDV